MADQVPIDKEIPVIDLGKAKGEERAVVAQQLVKASEEHGLFQVINHGIPENVMDEAMEVYQEFFSLPVEDKANYALERENYLEGRVYNSTSQNYGTDKLWRDVLQHSCNVDGEDKKTWPDNLPTYREVIGTYGDEVRKLSRVILGLLSEGLGLEAGYFDKEFGMNLLGMHYPTCPHPSSTLGIRGHCDPNLLTMIQQRVYGLQILKDGKWIGVEPLPHAFAVNPGLSLTVISNGKLASAVHRVATSATQPRISIGTFLNPEDIVEPAKSLVGPCNHPLFRSFNWAYEFIPYYFKHKSFHNAVLEPFKINA